MPNIEQARSWYMGADVVHDFDHVMRVYVLADKLAQQEGADLVIVRAAVLLHDARGDKDHGKESRKNHQKISAAFAENVLTKEGWSMEKIAAVQHCILAHRFRSAVVPETIEAKVVFDADKLDAIGAVGAARAIAYAALRGMPFYSEPSISFEESYNLAPGEMHTSYHEYLFKLRWIKDRLYTDSAREIAEVRHKYLIGFFEQLCAEYQGER